MLRNVLRQAEVRYQICNFAILKKYALLKLNIFVSFYSRVKKFLEYVESHLNLRLYSFNYIWKTNVFLFKFSTCKGRSILDCKNPPFTIINQQYFKLI